VRDLVSPEHDERVCTLVELGHEAARLERHGGVAVDVEALLDDHGRRRESCVDVTVLDREGGGEVGRSILMQ